MAFWRRLFTLGRNETYTRAYAARRANRKGLKFSAHSANYEVNHQRVSYTDEYIFREYLVGGQITSHWKELKEIGEQGVPILKQTGENGQLSTENPQIKIMTKQAVSLRFKAARNNFLAKLEALRIEIPDTMLRSPRLTEPEHLIHLINLIAKEGDEIAAKLSRGAASTTSAIDAEGRTSKVALRCV